MFSFPKRENIPEERYPSHCTDEEPMVREEKQFCYGPVIRAGSKISSGSWWQTHFFPGHPSASHPPLAALAGPAQRLGAFSQPKHLYPCPSRGSWLPSSANRPCRKSCRKGTVPRGLSRKRSPGSLPPRTGASDPDGLPLRGGWGG